MKLENESLQAASLDAYEEHANEKREMNMDSRPTKTPSRMVNAVKSNSDKSSARPRFFARPWFYIPAAFVLGPVIAGVTKIDNAAVAMGPFFLALLYAAFTAYGKSPTPQKIDAIVTDGRYVCRSCGSRFNEPKMRGNGWIELILYVFVVIVGGVIYSIWRRSGQNKECPQCGSRAFRLASEDISQQKSNAPTESARVPCPECMEPVMPGARKCKHCGSVFVITKSTASN